MGLRPSGPASELPAGEAVVRMCSRAWEGGTPQCDWRGPGVRTCLCVSGGSLGLQGVREGEGGLARVEAGEGLVS